MKQLAIGISDFKKLRDKERYFVDKSLFIKEIIDSDAEISLIPRPRRFGKTLNLSMLRYFYEAPKPNSNESDNSNLFKDLQIWQAGEKYREKCGKHPVIYLTFKDIKYSAWTDCLTGLKKAISWEFQRHLSELNKIENPKRQKYIDAIVSEDGDKNDYENSLKMLSEMLSSIYKSNPIILIDEYDMPIQAGYVNHYYDEVIEFIRNLLSGGLKDNTFLERSVMTGILRVAKESIFSGLNNVEVCSLISDKYADKFGFLAEEVFELLDYRKIDYDRQEVIEWYNGYKIGEYEIFNPWSILEFTSFNGKFKPYWINTSGNKIVIDLISQADSTAKMDFEDLLKGKAITKEISDNIVYADIDKSSNNIWNFLFFSGYLKKVDCTFANRKLSCSLIIPNQEVLSFYETTIINWFETSQHQINVNLLKKAFLEGDIDTFKILFTHYVMDSLSYFDVKGNEPERFYHAFVLGLMFHLNDVYQIKSNRESGLGRYDVMLIPKNKSNFGYVFEFKRVESIINETLESAAEKAIKQIKSKNYKAELESANVENIIQIAIAFAGKDILIKTIDE